MSLGSALKDFLLSFIRMIIAAIVALFKWIVVLIEELLPIIIIIAIIWLAPYAAVWLAGAGAPAWLVTAVTYIGAGSAYIEAAAMWVYSGVLSIPAALASLGSYLGFWGSAALTVGVCAVLAPEETETFLDATVDLGVAIIDTVVSAVSSAFGLPQLAMVALLGWWLVSSMSDDKDDTQTDSNDSSLGVSLGNMKAGAL